MKRFIKSLFHCFPGILPLFSTAVLVFGALLVCGDLRAQPAAAPEPPAAPAAPETPTSDPATAPADPGDAKAPGKKPPRKRPKKGAKAGAETGDTVDFQASLVLGDIPAFWEIDAGKREEALEAVLLEGSIAPPVPAKVVRYAASLLEKYDTNGDGALEQTEWSLMPGAPQVIDLNGDGTITLEELVRHIAVYGKDRTIHRPYPVPVHYRPTIGSGGFQLFKPLSAPAPTAAPPGTATGAAATDAASGQATVKTPDGTGATGPGVSGTKSIDPSTDMTVESVEQAETITDETSFEQLAAANRAPGAKKFYRPLEELRGVPAWFILRDRDGDGQISMLEFAPTLSPAALALFGKLDTNGDGLLTPDEVRKE